MPKFDGEGEEGPVEITAKKTSAAQRAKFANRRVGGGSSNSLQSGKMQRPLMDPNRLRIKRRKTR